MDTMKILVTAVIAVALIAVLGQLLGIFSFPQSEAEAIKKQLKMAEASPGKAISQEILFSAGTGLAAKAFETGGNVIGFECNNAGLCCPEGEKCAHSAIEWSAGNIVVKERKKIIASSRCEKVAELFSCKTFFGEKPAQLEIQGISSKQEFDLRKEKPKMAVFFKNSGNTPSFDTSITVEVFAKFFEDGIEKKTMLEEKTIVIQAGTVDAHGERSSEIEPSLSETGRFEAKITVSGRNSGFDSNSIGFAAFKSPGNCRVEKEKPTESVWIEDGKCGEKHFCLECDYGYECQEAWEKETGSNDYKLGSPGFAVREKACSQPN